MTKHFLDSSVVRPLLLSSEKYKQYFKDHFGTDRLYISNYIQMEFVRSFLVPCLHFYFFLDMPHIESIGEASKVWSNRFKSSEHKAVLQLMGDIFNTRRLSIEDPKDKEKALDAINQILSRYYLKIRKKFKNISDQGTHCERAKVTIVKKSGVSNREALREFQKKFLDSEKCQKTCKIKKFLLKRNITELNKYINFSENLSSPKNKENRGFTKIAEKLKEIIEGKREPSCKICEAIGDAVIALESPSDMVLDHTDFSFDHLCELIDKPHYKHLSEISFYKHISEKVVDSQP